MIFSIEPETKAFVARIVEEGRQDIYDCTARVCPDPVCRCRTAYVTMRPRSASIATRAVGIDLKTKTIEEPFRKQAPPHEVAFAEHLLAALDDSDFTLLNEIHFYLKNRLSEAAKPSEVKAHFDYAEIETSAVMSAYNDALPFGTRLHVAVANSDYFVLDRFCVRSDCKCTNIHLSVFPVGGTGGPVDSVGEVMVDYATADWQTVESEPLAFDVAVFRRAMETAYPDLYKILKARHAKLRAIYAHCRKRDAPAFLRDRQAPRGVSKAGSVGRNDPCPCGSGKKFKKCCMEQSTSDRG